MSHHLDQTAQACIDTCNVRATECNKCFSHTTWITASAESRLFVTVLKHAEK